MRLFGFEITRTAPRVQKALPPLTGVGEARGGWVTIFESFAGAWQRDVALSRDEVAAFFAVYACVTLIAQDIGKIRLRLTERVDAIWRETESSAFSPVLRKPNRFQTRQKFIEQWIVSKLLHGNAYALKQRDGASRVRALIVLDPTLVRPLLAPDSSVYYELRADRLIGAGEATITVPASEIIHDVMVPLHHPLCGVSPLYACDLAASQGLRIQRDSSKFFANGAQPGGVLTAPGEISDSTAARIKLEWERNYSGNNAGRTAVLGDGLKYAQMSVNAVDAQLVEQLKLSAEMVCSVFHVPPYMIGVGGLPTYNNIEALNQQYYTQCLQSLIEAIEALLDDGLALPEYYATEFDLDDLLRMDSATKMKTAVEGVGGGVLAPDEARHKFNLASVPGGATPYLQQQNYSLAALAERDRNAPFAKPVQAPAPPPPGTDGDDMMTADEMARALGAGIAKGMLAHADA